MVALPALFFLQSASCPAYLPYAQAQERCRYAEVISAKPVSTASGPLLAELDSLMLDCSEPDWNGYDANPISFDAYSAAKDLIKNLPPGFPTPSLAPDPDGLVTFEWRTGQRRIVLATVHPDFQISYAAIFGEAKQHGSEPFFGELPSSVRELVSRIYKV